MKLDFGLYGNYFFAALIGIGALLSFIQAQYLAACLLGYISINTVQNASTARQIRMLKDINEKALKTSLEVER
jgi:hypothetical protein